MSAARGATVTTDTGVELYYTIKGAGDPLVLVAGLADDHASWGAVADELAAERTVIAFDNRGIGRSSTPAGPYTIAQMADDAHQLVAALDVGPVDALGSSMGGAICQLWASDHPEDVRELILTNTWVRREPFLELLFEHWRTLARDGHGQRLLEAGTLFAFSPAFLRANAGRIGELIGTEPPPLDGYAAAAHACREHDGVSAAERIGQRTLVIAGEHDILTRPEQSRMLVELIAKAEPAWLPTGHMTFWEQPGPFVRLVRAFLSDR